MEKEIQRRKIFAYNKIVSAWNSTEVFSVKSDMIRFCVRGNVKAAEWSLRVWRAGVVGGKVEREGGRGSNVHETQ